MKRTGQALFDWWVENRWADLVTAVLMVGGYGVIVWRTGRFDMLAWLQPGDRRGLYSAFAVVISLTGAMSSVAVSQLAAAKGPRAMTLKKAAGHALAKSWRSIYVGAMGAVLLALLALGLDSTQESAIGHNASVARWAFLAALALGTLKFARLTALFQPIIALSVMDDAEADTVEEVPAPEVNMAYFEERARRRLAN